MYRQNQIKQTLFEPDCIAYIRGLVADPEIGSRSRLVARVCQRYELYDPRGRKQESGCLKVLCALEKAGHLILPKPRRRAKGSHPSQQLPKPVPSPEGVPSCAGKVRGLMLHKVSEPKQMRVWNDLMSREHPLGTGPLVGRQLRYLIGSEYGWLGGLGFAAAALTLADRDAWIGWDKGQREEYLHYVVGMNRFLIRPDVKCKNLASKVLSMSMAAFAEDFEQAYGYKPLLLESFVDSSFRGSCYRAANWIKVGETKGRGRQNPSNECSLSRKAIYVYPLEKDFRRQMGLCPNAGKGPLALTDGLESDNWAEHEFAGAPLGDARTSKRLVAVAAAKAEVPDRAFTGVAKGDWSAIKAYYRMIDQPEESEINMANILAPHQERTARRMMGQKTVLCIQDGSDLDYTNLPNCKGLGKMGSNQTKVRSKGLHLHSTFAVAANGLPLGVVAADCKAPEDKSDAVKRHARDIPIEEKKTFAWIQHYRKVVEMGSRMPQTRLISVCDREADFYELFDEQRQQPRAELLVRASHNRKIPEEPFKMFDAVRKAPVCSRVQLHITRQSARSKKSKQKARPMRTKRCAEMAVRYVQIKLQPDHRKDKEPIDAWLVHAREEHPPEDNEPVEWFLLTTIKITSAEDAEQCLHWYTLRWRIEDWHRVLKSGCRIDKLAHETAERLRRAIAINMVIAWRIMLMTLLSREVPDLPAEVMFSDFEIRTLKAYAKKVHLKPPTTLNEAVVLIAKIGGYIGRRRDPPPGHQILWQGFREFEFICLGFGLVDSG